MTEEKTLIRPTVAAASLALSSCCKETCPTHCGIFAPRGASYVTKHKCIYLFASELRSVYQNMMRFYQFNTAINLCIIKIDYTLVEVVVVNNVVLKMTDILKL